MFFKKNENFQYHRMLIETQIKEKFNKSTAFLNAKDITILYTFVTNQLSTGNSHIKSGDINQNTYKILCQSILVLIIFLNHRRFGKVERIKLKDYLHRNKTRMQEEILKSLTYVEGNSLIVLKGL